MAKEPDAGRKPGDELPDEADNLLSDTSMDDLDLESLLAEDDDPAARPAKPAPPVPPPTDDVLDADDVMVVDDGEIDLLADDEPAVSQADVSARAPAPAADVEELDADDLLADDEAGEETKSLSESSTNGNASSEPGGGAIDDLSDIDLLADDEPTAEVAPAAAAAVIAGAAAARKPGEVQKSEGVEEVVETTEVVKAKAKASGGKSNKKNLGKGRGSAETGARGGKKEKAKKESAPRKAPEPAPVAAGAGSSRGSVTFICSECYEEFLLPSTYSSEMLSCPECLHVGKRPDEDFLRTVNRHKAGERSSLLMAVVAAVLLLGVLGTAVWMTSYNYLATHRPPEDTILYGLAGGSVILTGALLWLVSRYEKNRWEVYF